MYAWGKILVVRKYFSLLSCQRRFQLMPKGPGYCSSWYLANWTGSLVLKPENVVFLRTRIVNPRMFRGLWAIPCSAQKIIWCLGVNPSCTLYYLPWLGHFIWKTKTGRLDHQNLDSQVQQLLCWHDYANDFVFLYWLEKKCTDSYEVI